MLQNLIAFVVLAATALFTTLRAGRKTEINRVNEETLKRKSEEAAARQEWDDNTDDDKSAWLRDALEKRRKSKNHK